MKFGKVSDVLFDWLDHPSRLTRTDDRYSNDAFMNCRRKHLLDGPFRHASVVDLWGRRADWQPWLRWLQQQQIEVRRVYEVHPRKIGDTIHNVPVIDGEEMFSADGTLLLVAVGADGARARFMSTS